MDAYDFYNKLMAIFQHCVDTDDSDLKINNYDDISCCGIEYDEPSIVVMDSSGVDFQIIIRELK